MEDFPENPIRCFFFFFRSLFVWTRDLQTTNAFFIYIKIHIRRCESISSMKIQTIGKVEGENKETGKKKQYTIIITLQVYYVAVPRDLEAILVFAYDWFINPPRGNCFRDFKLGEKSALPHKLNMSRKVFNNLPSPSLSFVFHVISFFRMINMKIYKQWVCVNVVAFLYRIAKQIGSFFTRFAGTFVLFYVGGIVFLSVIPNFFYFSIQCLIIF